MGSSTHALVGLESASIPRYVLDHASMLNSGPQVSVILAVHNAERTLREAIESVLGQTFHDLELIICDDASTDGTSALLASFEDRRLRLVRNTENEGPGRSRDRAIESSQGAWLAVIDADDRWEVNRLSILLQAAGGRQDVLVFDDIQECHDTPSGMVPWRRLRGPRAFFGDGKSPVDVPLELFVQEKRWLIKPLLPVKLVREHAITHTVRKVHEDNEFFLNCFACGAALRYVPAALYYYRITPGSATSNLIRSRDLREVIVTMRSRFPDRPLLQDAFSMKVSVIDREDKYMPFLMAVKERKLTSIMAMVWREPWFVKEMMGRLCREFPYHIHRLMHRGRIRGTR